MDHRQRVKNSDCSNTLINALKMLEGTSFEGMMGSGIMVRLTPITEGKSLGEEFMVAAEDLGPVAPLLATSIRNSLKRRTILLQSEISDINKALGTN